MDSVQTYGKREQDRIYETENLTNEEPLLILAELCIIPYIYNVHFLQAKISLD